VANAELRENALIHRGVGGKLLGCTVPAGTVYCCISGQMCRAGGPPDY
jgi:hypothetical protein